MLPKGHNLMPPGSGHPKMLDPHELRTVKTSLQHSRDRPEDLLAVHELLVPANYSLGGFEIATQAVVLGDAIGFCNAIDMRLGL